MILKHYGHLAPDYQEEAALAIGRGLKQRRSIGGTIGAIELELSLFRRRSQKALKQKARRGALRQAM
jgi:hypothetical protein